MKTILLLVALLSTACQSSDISWMHERLTHTIIVDSDFSDSEIELIEKSINEWEVATDHNFDVDVTIQQVTKENSAFSIKAVEEIWNDPDKVGSTGVDKDAVGRIQIVKGLNSEQFENTVKHEIGHYLGLDHNKDKNDLMYYQTSSSEIKEIQPHHIEEFNEYWGF